MPLHEEHIQANKIMLRTINTGLKLGLADATINGLTTPGAIAGLKTAVLALPVHEDQKYPLVRINKAVEASRVMGVYTEANVAGITTGGAGLQGLHVAADPLITDPTMYGNIFFGE